MCSVTDAFYAETLALSHAVQVADQFGVGRAVFETDCINLKTAMNTTDYDLGPLGILISDIRHRLRFNFIDARVVYAPRGCNKPAHVFSRFGCWICSG